MQSKKNSIYLIKSVAALLITNSHLDALYPVSFLSIGGSLGNTLFFIVSGYLISGKINYNLCKWMFSRFQRIYPSLWIISGVLFAIGYLKVSSCTDFIFTFLFPYYTYWFIAAILILYFLLWFAYRIGKIEVWIAFAIVVYIIWYCEFLDLSSWSIEGPYFFKYVFYFIAMLFGVVIRNKTDVCDERVFTRWMKLTVFSFIMYIITRGLVAFTDVFLPYQFIVHIFTLMFGVSFFQTIYKLEEKIKNKHFIHIIKVISDSTLEIYLLNYAVINYAKCFCFPLNVLFSFIIVLVLGSISNKCINIIVEKLYHFKLFTGVCS